MNGDLKPDDVVLIHRGRNAGSVVTVELVFPKTVQVSQLTGLVLKSSINRFSARMAVRERVAAEQGVTWEWLREEMSKPEADAWLGIDWEGTAWF